MAVSGVNLHGHLGNIADLSFEATIPMLPVLSFRPGRIFCK